MQSEGGAAGTLHGALQAGALGTTFTASQGLLLMIPESVQDRGRIDAHGDSCGCANDCHARALDLRRSQRRDGRARDRICHAVLLFRAGSERFRPDRSRRHPRGQNPFSAFFRRLPHVPRSEQDFSALRRRPARHARRRCHSPASRARSHPGPPEAARQRAKSRRIFPGARSRESFLHWPRPPSFKTRWTVLRPSPGARTTLCDYVGAPDAERVIVLMGSGAGAVEEAVAALNNLGEKVGLLKLRLFRPFPADAFLAALPKTVRAISVLDRTKEPGSPGEPLYMDVVTLFAELSEKDRAERVWPRIVGGRYGLSSKEFTPAMVKAVFDELKTEKPKNHFTIGIQDDVTHTSLAYDASFSTEDPRTVRAIFYGLGSDGTVGANKNSIKIIGENTPNHAQGYFVYDSKKAGSVTISHLRFGPQPIESTYLITRASFVACHQFSFVERTDVLGAAEPGATFLLNSPFAADQVWDHLPRKVQQQIVEKKLKFYRHRRIFRRAAGGNGQPHQHDHADLLLRHQRRAAARRSDCRHQARHSENLRQARRCRGPEKFRRRGCVHRSFARSESAPRGEQPLRYSAAGAGDRSGIRSRRSRRNDFRQRRFASR